MQSFNNVCYPFYLGYPEFIVSANPEAQDRKVLFSLLNLLQKRCGAPFYTTLMYSSG